METGKLPFSGVYFEYYKAAKTQLKKCLLIYKPSTNWLKMNETGTNLVYKHLYFVFSN